MKKPIIFLFLALLIWPALYAQNKVIRLYTGAAPGSENWNWKEKEMFSPIFNTQVVYNVVEPSLTVFQPDPARANKTAVIVAPGGGFHTLSINSEGNDVAKWLNAKGITVFVLKYRLVHSVTEDPVKELMGRMGDPQKMQEATNAIIPLSIKDGQEAMKYVRSHAAEYKIDPKKIGFMGFSAGGTVTMGVTLNYDKESRPDFSAPIYPFVTAEQMTNKAPKDAPPIFICAATDDNLNLAPHSVAVYNNWLAVSKSAELHMYAKGGHGFGMRKINLPTEQWIERFYDWLTAMGFAK